VSARGLIPTTVFRGGGIGDLPATVLMEA
jgi:hypothetical protein